MIAPHQEPCSSAVTGTRDRVLIIKSDRFYGQCLQHAIERTMVDCTTTVVHSLADAQREIATSPRFRLVVCGIGFPDGDALAWLKGVAESRQAQHLLVVTTRREPRVLTLLRTMPVDGVFDAYHGDMHEFTHAVTRVMTGCYFLSPSFAERLRCGPDSTQIQLRNLSPLEQCVLSVIGAGFDNVDAARQLGLSAAAVQSHRKRLHRKLGIAHKGELFREAIRLGLVRVDRLGNLREGFGQPQGSNVTFPIPDSGADRRGQVVRLSGSEKLLRKPR